jgi:hypothetical protein
MQRKKMFLVVCISALLAGGVQGQDFLPEKAKLIPADPGWKREISLFPTLPRWEMSVWGKAEWGRLLPARSTSIGALRRINIQSAVIPADRVVTHFGFFCKRELELEKMIRLPLRFRLGSLDYCNQLEGK